MGILKNKTRELKMRILVFWLLKDAKILVRSTNRLSQHLQNLIKSTSSPLAEQQESYMKLMTASNQTTTDYCKAAQEQGENGDEKVMLMEKPWTTDVDQDESSYDTDDDNQEQGRNSDVYVTAMEKPWTTDVDQDESSYDTDDDNQDENQERGNYGDVKVALTEPWMTVVDQDGTTYVDGDDENQEQGKDGDVTTTVTEDPWTTIVYQDESAYDYDDENQEQGKNGDVRVTDTEKPWTSVDEQEESSCDTDTDEDSYGGCTHNGDVDVAAELFIKNFRRQLRQQRNQNLIPPSPS